jgi:hypothetical protein
MALLHDQVLGNVRGTVRNLTFGVRNERNYFYTKPRKKILAMDAGSIFRRDQFRFIGKLSKAVYKTPLLRIAWDKTKTDKTWCTYDDIFKIMYNQIRYNDPGSTPILFPGSGFKLTNPVVQKTSGHYELKADGIGSMDNFDLLNTESITLIGIFIYNKLDLPELPKSIEAFSFSTNVIIPDLLSPFTINMQLNGDLQAIFDRGAIKKAFFTIALLDENKQPVSFSEILIHT